MLVDQDKNTLPKMQTQAGIRRMISEVKEIKHPLVQILEDLIYIAIGQVENKLKEFQERNMKERFLRVKMGLMRNCQCFQTPQALSLG